jgi:hypothetical protein
VLEVPDEQEYIVELRCGRRGNSPRSLGRLLYGSPLSDSHTLVEAQLDRSATSDDDARRVELRCDCLLSLPRLL